MGGLGEHITVLVRGHGSGDDSYFYANRSAVRGDKDAIRGAIHRFNEIQPTFMVGAL